MKKRGKNRMRLIDVSTLKEWVENWFTKNRFYHPYAKNNNIPIPELYDILEQMPTAQPERKGRWVKHEDRICCWYCSECHADNYYAYTWDCDTGKYEFQDKYCPNCGARMEP